MTNVYHASDAKGLQAVCTRENAGLKYLDLYLMRLDAGQSAEQTLGDEEAALVLLSGACKVELLGETKWEATLGPRADVFTAKPHAAYVPPRSRYCVTASAACEVAIFRAPAEKDGVPVQLKPEDCTYNSSGAFNWRRDIRMLFPPGTPKSQRLIIGETLNPPGNWSGIPPHKHDEINSAENILEEIYFFKMKPADGYGVQLVYNNAGGSGTLVKNNDAFAHYNSYHPTVAAPGVTIYYLWALAGEDRAYKITTDPRFSWVPQAEAVLKEKANV